MRWAAACSASSTASRPRSAIRRRIRGLRRRPPRMGTARHDRPGPDSLLVEGFPDLQRRHRLRPVQSVRARPRPRPRQATTAGMAWGPARPRRAGPPRRAGWPALPWRHLHRPQPQPVRSPVLPGRGGQHAAQHRRTSRVAHRQPRPQRIHRRARLDAPRRHLHRRPPRTNRAAATVADPALHPATPSGTRTGRLRRRPSPARQPPTALPGQDRRRRRPRHTQAPHDTLVRAAFTLGRLVAGGEFSDDEARSALHIAAQQRRIPTHEADEAITDGLDAGRRHPRRLDE
ncbi:hypothetical protein SAMN04489726_0964 [Allokutzneria albata]|uniref:Uncharacterized protein n=1 Tax=Allokutzneria albata TaxID=211114 RepID=A0A1G9S8P4_ALLAB|nr:hypothetical protein SAMN04489726_0964 [Allokutzneria albata]